MVKYLPEILNEINSDNTIIHKYMKDAAFSILMQYAFDPEKKMLLPEGDPEFRVDKSPMGLNPTNLRYESKRMYVFCRGDITQLKRETLFIQLLESLHIDEAKILLAIKDQELHKLYPNINSKLMSQFGICPVPAMEEEKPDRALPKSDDESMVKINESEEVEKQQEPLVNKNQRSKRKFNESEEVEKQQEPLVNKNQRSKRKFRW